MPLHHLPLAINIVFQYELSARASAGGVCWVLCAHGEPAQYWQEASRPGFGHRVADEQRY